MDTVLWSTVAAVLAYAGVVAHEAAHAVAFRRAGVRVAEIGFGAPFPPRITLEPTPRRPFALALSVWLVGAYVRPHEDDRERLHGLPYGDRAWINGSGIVVNLVLGLAMVVPVAVVGGRWGTAAVASGVAVLLWAVRRVFVAYVVPVLVLPVLGLFVWLTFDIYSRSKSEFTGGLADMLPTPPPSRRSLWRPSSRWRWA